MNQSGIDQGWPENSKAADVAHKRNRYLLKVTAWIGGIAAVCVVLNAVAGPLIEEHVRKSKIAQMEPLMRQLGAAGKPSAIVWLAQTFPNESLEPLQKLADSGNGEALFTLAWIKYRSDPDARDAMIKRSADAGYPPAITYQLRKTEA